MIPNMFEEVKGFSSETHIHEEELLFVEPLKENSEVTKFSWGASFVLIVVAILMIAMVLSTAIIMKRRKIALQDH